MRLTGKVALVTGAASGIGRGIAERFALDGAAVVIADINEELAAQTAAAIRDGGSDVTSIHLDVADSNSVTRGLSDIAARYGRLDVHVSNAGIVFREKFLECKLETWERTLRVNLTGCFLCGQAAAREMVRFNLGGRIINIASISGQQGGTGRAAYGASKAAIINLTQTMAVELGRHGITVNAIAPGPIRVPRTAHSSAQRQAFFSRMAIAEYGEPSDVAAAASYLASDDAKFVTGHVLNVDG